MYRVLVIQSSLNAANGNSSKLVSQYVDALGKKRDVEVTTRDLDAETIPHLSSVEMQAWMTPAEDRTAEQIALADLSDTLIAEVKQADEIVLGVPMYNFGIPSVLKAWFDRIARAGITFKYTEQGPVGLLDGIKVTILAARGGRYQGTEYDTQSNYLRHFMNFVGLTDLNFVYAEGLALGEESANEAFSAANEKIFELVANSAD